MKGEHSLRVCFWGVRGSIACPGPGTVRYGGNTPCVEVQCGNNTVILDGGTGLRPLGDALVARGRAIDADILLSHCHLDHIGGLPFFAPLFAAGNHLRLWAGHLPADYPLERALRTMMSPPLFPIEVETFRAGIAYRDFRAGEPLTLPSGLVVPTARLDHPDGATGYRLECGGRSVAYLTDTATPAGALDPAVVALASRADLLIYDCTYTEAEIQSRQGWGHSTWREAMRVADAAAATTLCIFHHDPSHDDRFMDAIAAAAAAARPGTIVAHEGMVLEL